MIFALKSHIFCWTFPISKEVYIWKHKKICPKIGHMFFLKTKSEQYQYSHDPMQKPQSINSQNSDGITAWVRMKCIDSVLGQMQSAFDLKSLMSHWNFPNMYFALPRTQSWMSLLNIRILDYILQYILLFPCAAKIQFKKSAK